MKTCRSRVGGGFVSWFAMLAVLLPVVAGNARPSEIEIPEAAGPVGRTLVPKGSVWRYLNDGTDPKAAWREPDFDDSRWFSGPAQLGYGDGDEATRTREGKPPHPVTAYFRKAFEHSGEVGFAGLVVRLQRDDGAVVYLNGREIVRDNLPRGEIGFETRASEATAWENLFQRFVVDAGSLLPGRNVLAVEVHQADAASSDLSFDLELTALTADEPTELPMVWIEASRPETSEPRPEIRVAPGQFRISRTPNRVEEPLTVFVKYDGTAAPGKDYEMPPNVVTFSAGKSEVFLEIPAWSDDTVEGTETVVAELVYPPVPEAILGTFVDGVDLPVARYRIDPDRGRALVSIRDADTSVAAKIAFLEPAAGTAFPQGKVIAVEAVAVDPAGYISRVELFDGDRRVGVSEVVFIREPDPGTPIHHHWEWTGATVGEHKLIARGVSSTGAKVESDPVAIKVYGDVPNPKSPMVHLTEPENGAVFAAGEIVRIRAEAGDPDGKVVRLEILDGETVLGSTEGPELLLEWKEAGVGLHRIFARAIDDDGHQGRSETIAVYIRETADLAFVQRVLPAAYVAGASLEVRLLATPPRGTGAWTIEDRPPAGWRVDRISDDGVFDAATGKVKFGPFTDATDRRLGYSVGVPAGTTGVATFTGASSRDGRSYPIAGDDKVGPAPEAPEFHPADRGPQDRSMTADELTAYAAAWKAGKPWGLPAEPIPMAYVARAGFLWKAGETYRFDPEAGAPPLCWVPASVGSSVRPASTSSPEVAIGSVRRFAVETGTSRMGQDVTLEVAPPAGTRAMAVEEIIPRGWEVEEVGQQGSFDAALRRIRWGLLFGDEARRLSYRLRPPAGASTTPIEGRASFDGAVIAIEGVARIGAATPVDLPRITGCRREPDGRVRLGVRVAADQAFVVEASNDLEHWYEVHDGAMATEEIVVDERGAGGSSQRYFRLRPLGR